MTRERNSRERVLPPISRADKLRLWAILGVFFLCGGILNHMDAVDEQRRAEAAALREQEQRAWAAQVEGRFNNYVSWEELVAQKQARLEQLTYTPPMPTPEPTVDPIAEGLETGYFRADVPMDYELQGVLREACEEHGIPWAVGLGLIETESTFNPEAVNKNSRCYGLYQLNPKFFPADISPADNIRTGIAYLGELLERYNGDYEAALTAYNAGYDTGRRGYAEKVLSAAERWREG